jgi:hypothetical protein
VQEIEVTPQALTLRACVWEASAQDYVSRHDQVVAR